MPDEPSGGAGWLHRKLSITIPWAWFHPHLVILVQRSIVCAVNLNSLIHLIVGRRREAGRPAGCPASYSGLHDYPSLIENKFYSDLTISGE
jgi:hypothetical protein